MSEASITEDEKYRLACGDEKLLTIRNCRFWKHVVPDVRFRKIRCGIPDKDEEIPVRINKASLDAIKMSCSAELLPLIVYAEFAKDAWDCLMKVGVWTDREKANYRNMLEATAIARASLDNVPEVDKVLTGRNYRKWKIYMQNLLSSKYLWTVVDGSDTNESLFYKTKNHNALVMIRMSCGEEMYVYIDEEDHAGVAWRKLEEKLGAATDASMVYCNEIIIENELLTVIAVEYKITSSNYETWVFCMKNYLIVKGLWGFLEEPKISDIVKDEEALDAIKASCTPEMRTYLLYMSCAKEAWEKLATIASSTGYDAVCLLLRHSEKVEEAPIAKEALSEYSEADKVLTRTNYQMWEEYLIMLFKSLLVADDHHLHSTQGPIEKACAVRIIKEACGPEMMPCIFRSKSPREALHSLEMGCSRDQKDEYIKYSRLLHAVQKNEFGQQIQDRNGELWRGAHKFFRDFPKALTAEITEDGSTALHVAVRLGRVYFVRELLKLMTARESVMETRQGKTALEIAAGGNYMEIVKMLVESNRNWVLKGHNFYLRAITIAAVNGNEKVMRYLYDAPSTRTFRWGANAAPLLTSTARLGAFDIVLDLLNKEFSADQVLMHDADGMTLLSVLAEKPSAFPSGNQFGFLGGWIYRLARSIKHGTLLKAIKIIPGSKMHGTLLKALKIIVPGVKKILDRMEKHDHAAEIVKNICSLLPNLNPEDLKKISIFEAIQQSTINGIIELFENLIDTNPYLEHYKGEKERGLFQIAIMARQVSIFKHMCEMGPRNQSVEFIDELGNNALHCAAYWDSSSQRVRVHGPALQMQREIQWFEEVERVVPPRYKKMRNEEKLTPQKLFSREHKDLAKEAEKWMKEMAQACIIVTALIATVMFAAPFTLPGGSDQNTGVSLTLKSRAFKVFTVSDVISLFTSCTSLLMFFSILTARYAEHDFLKSLPRRLILGLFTLFIAIATMMATFAATVVIVLREDAKSRAYIWVSILACIPVVIFASLQLPLFVNLVASTYGSGIFHNNKVVAAPLISIGYGDEENQPLAAQRSSVTQP